MAITTVPGRNYVHLVSLALAAAWVGCAEPEELDGEDVGSTVESPLGTPVTVTFQNGVAPSAAYAGTTDVTLEQDRPTTNTGAETTIRPDTDYPNGTGKVANALLRFDIGAIPKGSTVQSVKLTVNVTNRTSGQGFSLYASSRAWKEGEASWNRASASVAWSAGGGRGGADRGATAFATLLPSVTGNHTVTFNAAGVAAVQNWVNNPAANYGLSIDAQSNVDGLGFDSSEASNGASRPKLVITYVASPTAACDADKRARAALVPGAYRPGASTTGPVPCVALTRRDGDLVVDTANTVIEGIDLYGRLVLGKAATNVVVKNSVLHGPAPTANGALVVDGGGADWDRLGLTIEDSRIDLNGRENWFSNGINGGNFKIRRSEIVRGVDGIGLTAPSGNTVIEANWIHDGYWTSWTAATPEPKPKHSDMQTHSDGIQMHRGRNHVIRGNFIGGVRGATGGEGDDYRNAGMMISQGVDASAANRLDNVLIEKNWFQGGAATINLSLSNNNDLSTVTVRNNRFLPTTGFYILKGKGVNASISGNVLDATGAPVPIQLGK